MSSARPNKSLNLATRSRVQQRESKRRIRRRVCRLETLETRRLLTRNFVEMEPTNDTFPGQAVEHFPPAELGVVDSATPWGGAQVAAISDGDQDYYVARMAVDGDLNARARHLGGDPAGDGTGDDDLQIRVLDATGATLATLPMMHAGSAESFGISGGTAGDQIWFVVEGVTSSDDARYQLRLTNVDREDASGNNNWLSRATDLGPVSTIDPADLVGYTITYPDRDYYKITADSDGPVAVNVLMPSGSGAAVGSDGPTNLGLWIRDASGRLIATSGGTTTDIDRATFAALAGQDYFIGVYSGSHGQVNRYDLEIIPQSGVISGFKFEDTDGDGLWGPDEDPIQGWTINLDLHNDGTIDRTAMTDVNGYYEFVDIPSGAHQVTETMQVGFRQTLPGPEDNFEYILVVDPHQLNWDHIDFGNSASGSVHGRKFHDLDADGQHDDGEPFLNGWRVLLFDANGELVESTVTMDVDLNGDDLIDPVSERGWYGFRNLESSAYTVAEVLPTDGDWFQTFPSVIPQLADLPDESPTVSEAIAPGVHQVFVGEGEVLIRDFGNARKSSVHGYKFEDLNANGVDDNEPPLAGVVFTLAGVDEAGNPVVLTTESDETGQFAFERLIPGTYTVTETVPLGFTPSTPTTVTFTLLPGQELVARQGQSQYLVEHDALRPEYIPGDGYLEFINPTEHPGLIGTAVPSSPPGAIATEEYTGYTLADGSDVIEVGDSDTAAGDRADFDWVQEHRADEAAGLGNHPEMIGAMGWTAGTPEKSPHFDPGTEQPHGHSDEEFPPASLPHLENDAYPDEFFAGVDIFSIISVEQDRDVDELGDFSPREAALDYVVDFVNTVTGDFSRGVMTQVWLPGWTASTTIDDFVARWIPEQGGLYNFVAVEPADGPLDDQVTEIDAIKALPHVQQEILFPELSFGNFVKGSIHGYKFEDLNVNGVDDDEPRLPGVTITLTGDVDGDGTIDTVTTTTDHNGEYGFVDLHPGDYRVVEVPPTGSFPTTPAEYEVTVLSRHELVALPGQSGLRPPRLFAVPNDSSHEIVEVDPETGAELNRFRAPEQVTIIDGLAFDGNSLWFISGEGSDTLYELDPETGAVRDADVIASPSPSDFDGLAALDGLIYIQNSGSGDIIEFDPVTDSQLRVIDVNGLNPDVVTTISGGLSGIRGPNALIATDFVTERVLEIDPVTGLVRSEFPIAGVPDFNAGGAAVIDGEIYIGPDLFSNTIDVHRRDGTLIRKLTLPYPVHALGGDDVQRDPRIEVVVGPLLAFGNAYEGSVHGYKFEDLNVNGIDDGEPRLAGVEIVLNEVTPNGLSPIRSTWTNADGQYGFQGLEPGREYAVTEVPPTDATQTTQDPPPLFISSGKEWVATDEQAEAVQRAVSVPWSWQVEIVPAVPDDPNGTPNPQPVTVLVEGTAELGFGDLVDQQTGEVLPLVDPESGQTNVIPPGTTWMVQAELLSMELRGVDPVTGGEITLGGTGESRILVQNEVAPGQLPEDGTLVGTVDSFFDVFFEVTFEDPEIGPQTMWLRPDSPLEFQQAITPNNLLSPRDVRRMPTIIRQQELGRDLLDQAGRLRDRLDTLRADPNGDAERPVRVMRQARLAFGNAFDGSIHGYKFQDLNRNGIDDDEPPLAGVDIVLSRLTPDGPVKVGATQTARDGSYGFEGLQPGHTYIVQEIPPDGTNPTTSPPDPIFIGSAEEYVARVGQSIDSSMLRQDVPGDGYLEFINLTEHPGLVGTLVPSSPPGAIMTEEFTGYTRADGNDMVEVGDSDTTAGDRADFDWVQENRPVEMATVPGGQHPGMVGAMGWTVGSTERSPHIDPGNSRRHGHSDEETPPGTLPHLENRDYAERFFAAVDVFSIISEGQDKDTDESGDFSRREAALDYVVDFVNTTTGVSSPAVLAKVWIPGWTAATSIDDYLARWVPLLPGPYNVVAIEPQSGPLDDQITEIDAVKAIPGPIKPTREIVWPGLAFGNAGRPSAIQGTKFNDWNTNGVRDQNEPGLAGFTIDLYRDVNGNGLFEPDGPWDLTGADGGPIATAVTGNSGDFQLGDASLASGTYFVRERSRHQWSQTQPGNPGYYTINFVSGTPVTNLEFGNHHCTDRFSIDNGVVNVQAVRNGILTIELFGGGTFTVARHDGQAFSVYESPGVLNMSATSAASRTSEFDASHQRVDLRIVGNTPPGTVFDVTVSGSSGDSTLRVVNAVDVLPVGPLQITGTHCGDFIVVRDDPSDGSGSDAKRILIGAAEGVPGGGADLAFDGVQYDRNLINTIFQSPTISRVQIEGEGGDDVIRVGDEILQQSILSGGAGNDNIRAGGGRGYLLGGSGHDLLVGGAVEDIVNGGDGRDRIFGGLGADRAYGGNGDDLIAGYFDNDPLLRGGNGNDQVSGGLGRDRLIGDPGFDTAYRDAFDLLVSAEVIHVTPPDPVEATLIDLLGKNWDDRLSSDDLDNDGDGVADEADEVDGDASIDTFDELIDLLLP